MVEAWFHSTGGTLKISTRKFMEMIVDFKTHGTIEDNI